MNELQLGLFIAEKIYCEEKSPKELFEIKPISYKCASESFLISQSLKMVDKEIVVSYADTSQNHIGTIYQATNFIYTGLTAKHKDWKVEGLDYHEKGFSNQCNNNVAEWIGNRITKGGLG